MGDLPRGRREDAVGNKSARCEVSGVRCQAGTRAWRPDTPHLTPDTFCMTPEAVAHLIGADKTLARLIRKVGPCTLKPRNRRAPFQALVHAVTHQQLNGTAAGTILKRFIALYPGKRFPTPADVLNTP